MKPNDGAYNLTTTAQPGIGATTVRYVIEDGHIDTTFGRLEWTDDPPPGMFINGAVALRFLDATHFVGVNGNTGYGGTYAAA